MDKRKIMSLGRSSLVISLPRNWINTHNLKQGNFISMEVQRDQSLMIYPDGNSKNFGKDITLYIDINEDPESVNRSIIACYLNGYSNIILISRKTFSNPQQRAIRRIARILYLRIMESNSKNIILAALDEESRSSMLSNINKMHSITISMLRDIMSAILSQNLDIARTVFNLDDDVDQFCFFIIRLLRRALNDVELSKQLEIDNIDCMDYQILVYRIEHVADHAATIAQQIILLHGNNLKLTEELRQLIFNAGNKAIDCYDKAIRCFFSKEGAIGNEIIEQNNLIKELDKEIAKKAFLTPNIEPMTICSICSIRDAITRISEWSVAIVENAVLRSYLS